MAKKKSTRTRTELAAAVEEVWNHYRTRRPKARVLGKEVRRKILARLAEGYTVEELRRAIDGNFIDPHCCGQNDSGRPAVATP